MAKYELFDQPLTKWVLEHVGSIPVDRANPLPSSIKSAVEILQNGEIILIFPSGTRSETNTTFKRGAATIALSARVPLIPAFFQGPKQIEVAHMLNRPHVGVVVDETYIKVKGKWMYLYRAVTKQGDTIDFYLSPTRNTKAAKTFLGKALKGLKDYEKPRVINTDKAPTYGPAIAALKAEGKCPADTEHRQIKYLNNVIEADHGKLKRLIKSTLGFKSRKTAYATIKGFEVIRALKKGQAKAFQIQPGIKGEVRLIERAFGLGADMLSEVFDHHRAEIEGWAA